MADAEIKTVISANTSDFDKGLLRMARNLDNFEKKQRQANKQISQSFSQIGMAAKGFIGIIAGSYVVNYAKQLIDAAGQMKDLSLETGVAASTLSALKSQLEQGGSNVEQFAASVTKMNRAIAEAAVGGNAGLVDTFTRLGISITKLQKLTPEDQFFELAKALSEVEDIGERTRLGVDIFGRSFTSLLPLINDTNGELREYVNVMTQSGNALTDEQINRLDSFGDAITRLNSDLKNSLAGGFADLLKFFDDFESKSAGFDAIYNPTIDRIAKAAEQKRVQADRIARGLAVNTGNMPRSVTSARAPNAGDFFGPPMPIDARGTNKDIPTSKSVSNAQKLQEALNKMQRETSRDVYTAPFNELDKKLKEVTFTIEDMARQYKEKLTPEQLKQVETIKENVRTYDALQKEQESIRQATEELGGAFRDAFADAIMGAEDFDDVLGALGKRLQQIAFNKFIGDPLSKFANEALGSIGGKIFDSLPSFSFATGIKNVPYDMTARLHKGEQVVTRQGVDAMQRNTGTSGGGNVYNIDARGADEGAVARLERSLVALAGPGVIERRVSNAQTRGAL